MEFSTIQSIILEVENDISWKERYTCDYIMQERLNSGRRREGKIGTLRVARLLKGFDGLYSVVIRVAADAQSESKWHKNRFRRKWEKI